ncbi:MAG TPA: VOC family protein [Chitinophagaceae bacterium]|nr:VOC family protein [Chitinophagaceae bacterium]
MKHCKLLVLVSALVALSAGGFAQDEHAKLKIAHISILVNDYDEALKYYTEVLGFEKKADAKFGKERWVTVAPAGQKEIELVFVQATDKDKEQVGRQAGSRTFIVLNTNDCKNTFAMYKERGIKVLKEPTEVAWGVQAQFYDIYGNRFALLQVKGQ